MRIYYLGTCSGTEPFEGMHHCSLVFEIGGAYYWFDAGESCAYTAHTGGMDILRTKCIFVSHSHSDHIGGFPHLLSVISKLTRVRGEGLKYDNTLQVFFPTLEVFDAIKKVSCGKINPKFPYSIIESEIGEGVVFEDGQVRVSAITNNHTRGEFRSYSFLIEAEGKRVVFSGDLEAPEELDPIINGCDLLIMETGHHAVRDVCGYAAKSGVKALRFNHHGREIIGGREAAQVYVSDFGRAHNMDIKLCYDMMTEEI